MEVHPAQGIPDDTAVLRAFVDWQRTHSCRTAAALNDVTPRDLHRWKQGRSSLWKAAIEAHREAVEETAGTLAEWVTTAAIAGLKAQREGDTKTAAECAKTVKTLRDTLHGERVTVHHDVPVQLRREAAAIESVVAQRLREKGLDDETIEVLLHEGQAQ